MCLFWGLADQASISMGGKDEGMSMKALEAFGNQFVLALLPWQGGVIVVPPARAINESNQFGEFQSS